MSTWVRLARDISIQHNEEGWSCHSMDAKRIPDSPELDNLEAFADKVLHVTGRTVTPKEVREFFWEVRLSQRKFEKEPLIWSFYDKEKNISVLGLGYVPKEGESCSHSSSAEPLQQPSSPEPSTAPSPSSKSSEPILATVAGTTSVS